MKGWRFGSVAAAAAMGAVLLGASVARAQDDGYYAPEPVGEEPADHATVTDDGTGGDGDTWSQVGWGALTVASNLVYVPAKLVYAGLGGLTGGMALGLTGGDMTTAKQIWEPSLGGDYFLTPDMVQGQEGVSFAGVPAELTGPLPSSGSGEGPAPAEHGSGSSDYGS